ncbi:MAG: hypothetical protein NC087_01980 [Anaeroplasma bactoclasticum]|nr:hypothetical protein [Anaeroplasma bactoclasticum]
MGNPFVTPSKNNNEIQKVNEITLESAMSVFREMLTLGINPQQIEHVLFANHPKFKEAAETIKKSGLNPIDYAMKIASQRKINLTPALQSMISLSFQRKI